MLLRLVARILFQGDFIIDGNRGRNRIVDTAMPSSFPIFSRHGLAAALGRWPAHDDSP